MEFKLRTSDGLNLQARGWLPVKSTACIVLVHGLGEHGGRYSDWAVRFAGSSVAFFTYDQRGHGRSEGRRGHIPSYESLLADLELFIQNVRELVPNTPLILYGHSMGGGIVLNYLIDRKPELSAAIVTSPWLKLAMVPSNLKIVMARILKSVFPGLRSSNGLDVRDMSHFEEVVMGYREDPLVHRRISLRLFLACRKQGLLALEKAGELPVPVLLMHGTGDRITSWQASQELAEKAGDQVHLKLWDEQYHELHNDQHKEEVFTYIEEWLSRAYEVQN